MSDIDEVIIAANNLCATLDKAANDENKYFSELQLWFESWAFEMFKLSNELKEIKYNLGE